VILASVGATYSRVKQAVQKLKDAGKGEGLAWAGVLSAKPVPRELLELIRANPRARVISVEDGAIHGGFGQQIGAHELIGYEDRFFPHGSPAKLEELAHVSVSEIEKRILALL
jgi:deoxyxylulose-5-phosphate synthase